MPDRKPPPAGKSSRRQIDFQTQLLDQVNDAILTLDQNFRVQYCNRAAEHLFGWTTAEAIGQRYKTVAGTAVTESERQAIHRDILSRGAWNGEIICTKRGGAQFLVHVSWSVLRDSAGRPEAVVGIHRDITTPKQMEQALHATEDRLKLVQSALALGTWDVDLTSGTVQCSEHLMRMLGQPGGSRELNMAEWQDLVHPDDRSPTIASPHDLFRDDKDLDRQFRVTLPDGSIRWFHRKARLIFDKEQRPTHVIGVDFDVTEQKKVERANADLAAVVECADAAIISKDRQGIVLTWNRGAERVYGYTAEEMVGKTMAALIPSDRLDEDKTIMETLRRGEAVNHLETVRLTKSGEPISVLLTLSPIRDRNGTVLGAAHVAWDITPLKRLEQQLAQAQKLESIGELAAGIAHEINTPIQYIGDNGRFLEDAFRDLLQFAQPRQSTIEDGVLEYLQFEVPKATEQLLHGVDHVARIVRAMKEFSHPGPVEKMPIDINRAIESTIVVSRNEWKYVAELTTEFDSKLPPVPCLGGEFNQVILNLIVNAAHAITDVIRGSDAKGKIHIRTRADSPFAEIRISDTGGGIPESIRSKVFDPFFTTKPVGKGTGQGLSIAHAVIVQKHRGTIHFESESGKGTTFVIRLPLAAGLDPS